MDRLLDVTTFHRIAMNVFNFCRIIPSFDQLRMASLLPELIGAIHLVSRFQ